MCRIRLPALIIAVLLSGCDEPRLIVEDVQEQTEVDSAANENAVMNPDAPGPEPQDEVSRQPEKKQKLKRLDLTIDHAPPERRPAAGFGSGPESDWLQEEQGATGLGAGANSSGFLPDLFDNNISEKPVSVKGKLLTDGAAGGASGPVDGAGLSIEFKTD